jgi:dUTPase
MPEAFAIDFPNTVAILKQVQIKVALNSFESVKSRTSTSTKDEVMLCNRHAVLAVDPRGSVIWCSKLSKGNLSDSELFIESGLKDRLKQLVGCHWLQVGDGILADETFGISEELDEIGLVFNHESQTLLAFVILLSRDVAKYKHSQISLLKVSAIF